MTQPEKVPQTQTHDTVIGCRSCGWTASGNHGDLVLSTQDAEGRCLEHTVHRI